MAATITEIAPDTFRIAQFNAGFGITFNQFLVRDEAPLLYHTGFRRLFPETLAAVATLIDPAKLAWIGFSHFEPDECGALNDWLAIAANATAVASFVGAGAMLGDFADRPARACTDGEVIETGRHAFRFLSTPHLPHGWDASFLFDETERTLFCSDLLLQPGDTAALEEGDIVGAAASAMKTNLQGPFAHDLPYTAQTAGHFAKLCALAPTTLATMHGASFRGDGAKALAEFAGVAKTLLSTSE